MKKIKTFILFATIVFLFSSCRHSHEKINCQKPNQSDWKSDLTETLPLMGHRNWIIIADAAFPLQSAEGIKTIYCNSSQFDVVKEVLAQLKNTKHVKPTIFTDRELDFVNEKQSAGVTQYRNELKILLKDYSPQTLLHDSVFAKLDQASKLFNVLIFKTGLTIPYSSVFMQLECGYWNSDSEKELREAMNGK